MHYAESNISFCGGEEGKRFHTNSSCSRAECGVSGGGWEEQSAPVIGAKRVRREQQERKRAAGIERCTVCTESLRAAAEEI